MSQDIYTFELVGDYKQKLSELADSDNVIKFDPLTATKSQFACYQMYLMTQNSKQVSDLTTQMTAMSIQIKDLETAATAKDAECNQLRADLDAANLVIAAQGRDFEHLSKRADQADQNCLELERHSRSSNVRMGGVDETKDEDCLAKVTEVFQKHGLESVDIENCHRVGKKEEGKSRYIIVRFVRRLERRKVLAKRKDFFDGGNPLYEDIPYLDLQVKKKYKGEIDAHYKKKDKVYFSRGAWYVNDVKKYW